MMLKGDQEIRFYTIQKDRQKVNDAQRKELDELHNKSPYSIVAFPEMQNYDHDNIAPQDNSLSVFNQNPLYNKKFGDGSIHDEAQNSFSSKLNDGDFYCNHKHTSPSFQYGGRSIENSSQDLNNGRISAQVHNKQESPLNYQSDAEKVLVSLKETTFSNEIVKFSQDPSQTKVLEQNLVATLAQHQSQQSARMEEQNKDNESASNPQHSKQIKQLSIEETRLKKTERRAVLNWRKMKQLYKKNKPQQQITQEQYRLINDWASNEYKIIIEGEELQRRGGSTDPSDKCCGYFLKGGKLKKKIKKNSIIQSLFFIQEAFSQVERQLFPYFSHHIPVIQIDSFLDFFYEVYLFCLYSYFLFRNWMILVYDTSCNQTCTFSHERILSIVFISCIIECLKNFNKAITVNGKIISERKQIVRYYFKQSFPADFIFLLIIILIQTSSPNLNYLEFSLRLCLFIKFKSYFCLMKNILSYFEILDDFHNIIQARVIQSIDETTPTWVDSVSISSSDWRSLYVESMKRVSFLMIGISDPGYKSNNFEKVFDIFIFLIGITLFSYFIQKNLSFLKDLSKKKQQQRNEINGMISHLGKLRVKQSLKMEIVSYLNNYHTEELNIFRCEGTQEALKKLSDELKNELIIHTNTGHLRLFSFFTNFSEELKRQLMNIMVEKIYQPGQLIFEDGETTDFSIFLINKGRVDLYYDTRKCGSKYSVVKEISKDQVFGQISFLTGFPRKCYAISKEITSLISINREEFLNLLKVSREEKDLQIFCQMKDLFLNEGDQNVLDLTCFQCGSNSHLSDQCIKTHYYIHRKAILKTLSSHYKMVSRKRFKRFRSDKNNTLQKNSQIQKTVAGFVEKFEEQINFLQEDIHMKRFQNLQSQQFSHNYLKHTGSSEQALPIQNSDDNLDYQQSSESSDDDDDDNEDAYSDNKTSISDRSQTSYTEKGESQVISEKEGDEKSNISKKRGSKKNPERNSIKNAGGNGNGSHKNLNNAANANASNSVNQNSTVPPNGSGNPGKEKPQKLKSQRSGSMNNLSNPASQITLPNSKNGQSMQQLPPQGYGLLGENSKSNLSNLTQISTQQQSHRLSSKPNTSQINTIHTTPSTLSANTPNQHINSDIKNEEIEEFLNINNELTISSIFQNFQSKKQQPGTKDGNEPQSLNRQRSSYKLGNRTPSISGFSNNPSTNQRGSNFNRQSSSASNNIMFAPNNPKISVSCSDFDSNSSNLNNAQSSNYRKKSGSRSSFSFMNPVDNRRSIITNKDNIETSSSTESNTTELFFDPQLAPLTTLYSQPQMMHTQNAFEQGNIFIIDTTQGQQEEKNAKKTKFDILQEKMKDNDSESTPVSLLESIYNVDSHPNNQISSKRKGILPYSTSLSENMRKIARLYSKGSTKTSQGIGQVLNLQLFNQFSHKQSYTNPNDIYNLMYLDKMKNYHYYFPTFNVDVILKKLDQKLQIKSS